MTEPRVVVVGRGRAGGSFAAALLEAGWSVRVVGGRSVLAEPASDQDELVLICVPDAAVHAVANGAPAGPRRVVAHCAGSLPLAVLAPHANRGSIHPLVSLPDPSVGSARLLDGATFAVAGHPLMRRLVGSLGGKAIEVPDEHRAQYHAAACIASNHLVGLLGQVERVASAAGIGLDAFMGLVRGTVDNVAALGPASALTGPAARGDMATLARHRSALDPTELGAYDAMVEQCRRLVAR